MSRKIGGQVVSIESPLSSSPLSSAPSSPTIQPSALLITSTPEIQEDKWNDEEETIAVELLKGEELKRNSIGETEGDLLDEEQAKADQSSFMIEDAPDQDAADALGSDPIAGPDPTRSKAGAIPTRRVSLEKRTEIYVKYKEEIQGSNDNGISPVQARRKEVINEGEDETEQINGVEVVEKGRLPGKALDAPRDLQGPGENSSSTDIVQKNLESELRGGDNGNAGEDQRIAPGTSVKKAAEELEQSQQNATESRPSAEVVQIGNEEPGESHGCEVVDGIEPACTEASIDKTTVEPEQRQEAPREILSTTGVASEVQNGTGQGHLGEPVKEGAEPEQPEEPEEPAETVTTLIIDAKTNPKEHKVSQLLAEPPLNADGDAETVQEPQRIIEAGPSKAHSSPPLAKKIESEPRPASSLKEATCPPTVPKIRKGHLASLLVLNPAYTLPSHANAKPRRFFCPHKRKVMIGDESLERISIPGVKKTKTEHVEMMYQVLLVDKPQDGLRSRR
ncbi:hypothetical protein C343_04060 [Cryptococcus neoformans C23]|uniref:Uncharacterized protein n=1 Tax=Cryptococcus neoformans (strain H99 / ATCC 208821 / CBS 10515 / FGSC 9487) TaxID=235443 RepID=J9VNC1_CRYN9|nr:hypothetical protein CNAG_06667 [Cryptococcus neoformans var. grubii H99]AFR95952.1 hypothetical protein CNAG_06667 [Cryptococcus neoformans var. grubii H99]AUB25814.1 hypothetical protein CKF44_06667 [Cryptococcus neoformans var. grubii]OWZ43022.1 hypothetical protein C343_04060 [Cryptococcus neoformans var. grubii C23]|eukprot:XP_012050768.1 hypothetical protein CNAG_06667 [Cryptococcus neoformans var. grubii H99]